MMNAYEHIRAAEQRLEPDASSNGRRDGGYCRWPHCPYLGPAVTIDAHHKATRSQRPDLKYELSNGITLCRFHHGFTHGEGKREAIELGILIIGETYERAQKELRAA